MNENEFDANIRKILISKLEEMAKIKFEDCANKEYPEICNVMNQIAKTLLGE
ncbi:MAG: hypothetical protein K2H29_04970 [Oscillospiraceae bacterium]|nr:hypothetical protein [Oscillospiraceae bacterium]